MQTIHLHHQTQHGSATAPLPVPACSTAVATPCTPAMSATPFRLLIPSGTIHCCCCRAGLPLPRLPAAGMLLPVASPSLPSYSCCCSSACGSSFNPAAPASLRLPQGPGNVAAAAAAAAAAALILTALLLTCLLCCLMFCLALCLAHPPPLVLLLLLRPCVHGCVQAPTSGSSLGQLRLRWLQQLLMWRQRQPVCCQCTTQQDELALQLLSIIPLTGEGRILQLQQQQQQQQQHSSSSSSTGNHSGHISTHQTHHCSSNSACPCRSCCLRPCDPTVQQ
ncbi:hypothetical protein COO60DRAFT_527436 [Scenedesmus sp. NREL 46B-D3]|nr:hypothetical protein COO60DRAFT_527436 [Scenedesmus sp. NREL 46B-D3]